MSRHFQPRRRQHVTSSTDAREWLNADHPETLKQRVFLASRGALKGPRRCLFCLRVGLTVRLHVPFEALRVGQPDLSHVEAYWVCQTHNEAPTDASEVPRLLAARRAAQHR